MYIGQSRNVKKRFSNYKYYDCKKQIRLHASFIKYGVENHIMEILEECELLSLNIRERYYQDLYSVLSMSGLNCTLTEANGEVRVYSDATRKKMSDSSIGKLVSEETKRKLSIIGKAQGGGFKKGHKHSMESKLKMSESKKGISLSGYAILKSIEANSKVVLDIETGVFYSSIKECAELNGYTEYNLRRYLSGTRKKKTKFIKV